MTFLFSLALNNYPAFLRNKKKKKKRNHYTVDTIPKHKDIF